MGMWGPAALGRGCGRNKTVLGMARVVPAFLGGARQFGEHGQAVLRVWHAMLGEWSGSLGRGMTRQCWSMVM